MISQLLISTLLKQSNNRKDTIYLIIKILFTLTLTFKIFQKIDSNFLTLQSTDFYEVIYFLLDGYLVAFLSAFIILWLLCYEIIPFLFFLITIPIINFIFNVFREIQKISKEEFETEIENNKIIKTLSDGLNFTDIIEIEENKLKPGTNYFQFYDYMLKIRNNKIKIDNEKYIINISFIIQLCVIYYWSNLVSFSFSSWYLIIALVVLIAVILLSYIEYVFSTFLAIKFGRILNFMKRLTPKYEESITKNIDQ
jgi:hypothetical protein